MRYFRKVEILEIRYDNFLNLLSWKKISNNCALFKDTTGEIAFRLLLLLFFVNILVVISYISRLTKLFENYYNVKLYSTYWGDGLSLPI